MNGIIHIFENVDALYAGLEDHWLSIAESAIESRGAFHVALAGGNTPRNLYDRLTRVKALDSAKWANTHIYFGDERCVPQGHPDSNYRMVQETLLSHVPLLPEHVHAMFSAERSVEENVACYDALLRRELPHNPQGSPIFDLILLGMGEDGHTASLFPDTDILDESEAAVAAQYLEKLSAWRMSLTFPTINAAQYVAILVVGESKADILSAVSAKTIPEAEGNTQAQYPVQRVQPAGQLDWYLDAAAARLLPDQQKS